MFSTGFSSGARDGSRMMVMFFGMLRAPVVCQPARSSSSAAWAPRFTGHGPEGLLDSWSKGPEPRLSHDQRVEIAKLVATGPDQALHGVVRWRRIDLQRVILERFGIAYHERTIGKLLKALGFSHMSARPRHLAQDPRTIEAFKKTFRPR